MLWTHQKEAIEWARGRRSVLLHLGMGCGKTRTALEIVNELLTSRSIRRILVGCPKAVVPAWAKQATLWMPSLRVVLLDKGTSAKKGEQIQATAADTRPVAIVGNYESLFRIAVIERLPWDVFIWDEVHRLKSPSGSTSRWAGRLVKRNPSAIRIGLSGTLLAHSPLDAWGVYRAVESPECETFGQSYTAFKAEFAVTNPRIPGMVLAWRNQKVFAQKIAATTFHRRSEDVLDLPEIMHEEVAVELSPAEARVYQQLEHDFCADVDGGTITPQNAMIALLRMLQACQGYMRLDDSAAPTAIGEEPSKKAALRELLEDLGPKEPVVLFARFRTDLDFAQDVCRSLGLAASELSGRADDLAAWQAGKTTVLIAQLQSGGIGIDLTRASYAVFLSLEHSLSGWLQAIARLHRPGQTRTTHFYSLVSKLRGNTTADGRVYQALINRKEVIDDIIQGYRGRREHAGNRT